MVLSTTAKGSYRITYTIGPIGKKIVVCKKAFAMAYGRGETFMDDIIKDLKITKMYQTGQLMTRRFQVYLILRYL